MKNLFLLILTICFLTPSIAQESLKQREVGFAFSNFNQFGLIYKSGTQKSLWRFETLALAGDNNTSKTDDGSNTLNSLGFSLRIGRETRKNIVPNLELRLGGDISFLVNHSKRESKNDNSPNNDRLTKRTTYEPGINFVFGLNYVVKEKLVLGVEVLPGVSYLTGVEKTTIGSGNEEKTDYSGFSYGFRNSFARLTVAFRFN